MNIKQYKEIPNYILDKKASLKKVAIKLISGVLLASTLMTSSMDVKAAEISLNKTFTLEQMNQTTNGLGKFVIEGMPSYEYDEMMNYVNEEVVTTGNPIGLSYDIAKFNSYSDIENILVDYSKYDNVTLNIIGKSVENRNIYSIEIGTGDKVILLTGGVHARETAGTSFIMKQLNDLLIESNTNVELKALLTQFKIVAVPCANPDGRVVLENNPTSMKKSNINGVDLGRNFPSVNAGQLGSNNSLYNMYSLSPSDEFYAGPYLGSEPEVQALMRLFMNYYDKTVIYMDEHQAGQLIYTGKPAGISLYEQRCYAFASSLVSFTSKNGAKQYEIDYENPELKGYGEGTTTDFFSFLAEGALYSPYYGRFGMNTESGIKPLLFYNDSDNVASYNQANTNLLAVLTYEIGTKDSRGYTEYARNLQAKEYESLNMSDVIRFMMDYSYIALYGQESYDEFILNAKSIILTVAVNSKVIEGVPNTSKIKDLNKVETELEKLKKIKEEYISLFGLYYEEKRK